MTASPPPMDLSGLRIPPPDQVQELARQNCLDCAWYHGFWPLVRALGLGTVPEDHAAFYSTALDGWREAEATDRVLVCGAADASMPWLIHRILRGGGHAPELTILDRCATPLALCRDAFREAAIAVRTVRSEVLDAHLPESFDLIVTHSFLGYFTASERPLLFAQWFNWLRSGGRVLTVNRLRPDVGGRIGFSSRERDAFVDRVLAGAAERPGVTALSRGALTEAAGEYANRFHINALTSLEEIESQVRAAGFTLEVVPLGGVGRTGPSGPTAPGSASYYGFILSR